MGAMEQWEQGGKGGKVGRREGGKEGRGEGGKEGRGKGAQRSGRKGGGNGEGKRGRKLLDPGRISAPGDRNGNDNAEAQTADPSASRWNALRTTRKTVSPEMTMPDKELLRRMKQI